MSVLVVNKFREFIEGLDLSSRVLSVSNDGTNTTLKVAELYHIRALEAPFQRSVLIDSVSYPVLSVDYEQKEVIVEGVIASATVYQVPNPFYFHGTLISTHNEVINLTPAQKFPMVYLNEIISETRHNPLSNSFKTSRLRVAFLDYYSNDWTRQEHYRTSIAALQNLADFIAEKLFLRKVKCLGVDEDIFEKNVPKWGKINNPKGNSKKWFSDYLDAIEWEFDVYLNKC